MAWKEVLDKRRNELFGELHAARKKFAEAKDHLTSVEAKVDELMNMEMLISRDEDGSLDADAAMRLSANIRGILALNEGGLTLAQLSDMLGVRKQHASATLYNMKRRNEVEHDEVTGVYRLNTSAMLPRRPPRPVAK
jgi:hypothetical protein